MDTSAIVISVEPPALSVYSHSNRQAHISNAILQIDFYNCTYAHLFISITSLRSFLSLPFCCRFLSFPFHFHVLAPCSWRTNSVSVLFIVIEASQTLLPIVSREKVWVFFCGHLNWLATSQTIGVSRRLRRQRKIIICDLFSINFPVDILPERTNCQRRPYQSAPKSEL